MAEHRPSFRLNRPLWTSIVFLAGFTVLLTVLSHYFLLPALALANGASPSEKRQLSAAATLLLAVVLFVLTMGLLILFRVRRFFFPSPASSRQKTEYIDAWSEAGRCLKTPESDSDEPRS